MTALSTNQKPVSAAAGCPPLQAGVSVPQQVLTLQLLLVLGPVPALHPGLASASDRGEVTASDSDHGKVTASEHRRLATSSTDHV